MTFELHPKTEEATTDRVERLHEFALNDLGLDTDDVLVRGYPSGHIEMDIGRIGSGVDSDD